MLLGSCAPRGGAETTLRNAQQLSASAIAYSDALSNLVDTTIELRIEENNVQLLRQYDLVKGMTDEATRKETLSGFLKDQDEAVSKQIDALREYKVQLSFLEEYFTNLQALANADVGSSTRESVAQLAQNIDAFNNKLGEQPAGSTVSEGESTALGGLAGLVVENIRARALENALKRDAATIDAYFQNQDKMLDVLAGILKSSSDRLVGKEQQQVTSEYVNVDIQDTQAWSDLRRKVLLSQFSNAAVASARDASKELRTVWRGILQGEDDLGAISAFLTNVNDFVDQANAFKTAEDARKAQDSGEGS
jgi:hypothetical protein